MRDWPCKWGGGCTPMHTPDHPPHVTPGIRRHPARSRSSQLDTSFTREPTPSRKQTGQELHQSTAADHCPGTSEKVALPAGFFLVPHLKCRQTEDVPAVQACTMPDDAFRTWCVAVLGWAAGVLVSSVFPPVGTGSGSGGVDE